MDDMLKNYGYGSSWRDFHCDTYQGFRSNMSDYHMHGYYEISLILSGNVKILLPKTAQQGQESRLVLLPPMTPHLMLASPNALYKRINLLFSKDFLYSVMPKERNLLDVFEKDGTVIILNDEQTAELYSLAREMHLDEDLFRRRLRLMIFLSKISDEKIQTQEKSEALPRYITDALSYIQNNYSERIVASNLSRTLGVGRTTLFTSFKKYTGTTLNDYLMQYRVNKAIKYLRQGKKQQDVAESCGFGDACNLNRAFKRVFNLSPGKYLKKTAKSD